ncbi:pyridoxal phosphate-dependent transferase [Infundibulicybe gibba]|nr:pyridoxal phosphate-dependent transferase [Infundibulicybe gibba]
MPIHGLPASLRPYRCARDDYQQGVLLDANENALGHSIPLPPREHPKQTVGCGRRRNVELKSLLELDLHRYPDPAHNDIKERIAALRSIPGVDHVFLGVGSDEVIDLLIRVACVPGREVNDVRVVRCDLELTEVGARVDVIKKAISDDPSIRLIFLCSPGNPTGTSISLVPRVHGIIVVDEATSTLLGPARVRCRWVREYANLCVMQTLSKSFGLAAIRLGIAIAQPAPYTGALQHEGTLQHLRAYSTPRTFCTLAPALSLMRSKVASLLASRAQLITALAELAPAGLGAPLGAGDANFVLIPVLDAAGVPDSAKAEKVYRRLAEEMGVVVRYRGAEPGENATLLKRLAEVLGAL